jgi:hypothetical protein
MPQPPRQIPVSTKSPGTDSRMAVRNNHGRCPIFSSRPSYPLPSASLCHSVATLWNRGLYALRCHIHSVDPERDCESDNVSIAACKGTHIRPQTMSAHLAPCSRTSLQSARRYAQAFAPKYFNTSTHTSATFHRVPPQPSSLKRGEFGAPTPPR